jgi:hypothetical protein
MVEAIASGQVGRRKLSVDWRSETFSFDYQPCHSAGWVLLREATHSTIALGRGRGIDLGVVDWDGFFMKRLSVMTGKSRSGQARLHISLKRCIYISR